MRPLATLARDGRVALIALDDPVNAPSHAVRSELIDVLGLALADPSISAIVLCCEGKTFGAGADLEELGKPPLAPDVPALVEFVAAAAKPIVAALHGTTLGGGLALALACSFRLAAAGTRLGFPEVTLGLLPGAGGTQRLPRLLGVRAALELIVGGAPVSAERAHALGLVDAVVHGNLRAAALQFAQRLVLEGAAVRRASAEAARLEDPQLLAELERGVRERARGALAPLHCVQAVRVAVELPFAQGLQRERELLLELTESSQARALRHVFLAEREVARVPGLPEGTPAREVTRAAVIGSGTTGRAITLRLADAGVPVTMVDASAAKVERAFAEVKEEYAASVRSGQLPRELASERLERVTPTTSYGDAASADFVFEAVPEDLAAKRRVFASLDRICKAGAVLATTTTHFDVDEIAWSTKRPEDVVAFHFPGFVEGARVVEVGRARRTTPEVWATALKLGRSLGLVAVPVTAGREPVGERMFAQLLREALFLLEDGALPEQVDAALREFGFLEGPFSAIERGGLDLLRLQRTLQLARLPAQQAPDLLARLGAGGRPGSASGCTHRPVAADEILERCLGAAINEGAKILDEGAVARALAIDLIWVHGYGFPAHRGGPMFHADELGLPRVQQTIVRLQRRQGPQGFTPAPLIERLAAEERRFHASP